MVAWAREAVLHVPVLPGTAALLFLLMAVRGSLVVRSMAALTERVTAQRGEQRFRSLVQNAPDVVVVVGGDGRVRYQTWPANRFLGYAAPSLPARSLVELVHPGDLELARACAAEQVPAGPSRSRLQLADGSWAAVGPAPWC